MAKEQKEHTTIGFSKSTIATVMLVLAVIGALVFWNDRGKAEATTTVSHDFVVASHEKRISKTETDIGGIKTDISEFEDEVKERFVGNEKMQIKLEKDQQAILSNQTDFKIQQGKHTDLIIKQMESQAEISAWIKTIEKVE